MKVKCVSLDNDFPQAGLVVGKVYEVIPDSFEVKAGVVIIDDEGSVNALFDGEYEIVEE